MLGRNGNIAYVRYDHQGRIVPGGPIISARPPKVGNWKAVSDVIGTNTTSNALRAFIRIDYFNRVVPSSLVLLTKEPGDNNSQTKWIELIAQCRSSVITTTTTTTLAPITTTTTTSSSTSTTSTSTSTTTTTSCPPPNICPEGASGSVTGYACYGTTEAEAITCFGAEPPIRYTTCSTGDTFWIGQHILTAPPGYCEPAPDGWYWQWGYPGNNLAQVINGEVVAVSQYP